MKERTLLVCAAIFACSASAPAAWADTVRLHGATTVVNVVVNPYRDAVQKATGHTLEIASNSTGKGLVALTESKADAAMVSEPLDLAVESASLAGKKIDLKTLQMHEIRKDEIVFVVHSSNPVGKLTWEQLRDIHTGKATNWKQFGGNDAPIVVYADTATGATRAMIKQNVMGGADYGAEVKTLTNVARVGELVAKDANGVGGLGKGFVDEKVVKIVQTRKLERPLAFVTVGAPSPQTRQVIDAFRVAVTK